MPINTAKPIPELLAPAGNFEKLQTAILYGADAVYLAGKQWGLRARAGNFDREEILAAVNLARDRHVKIYITVNILAHNHDFKGLADYLRFLDKAGVDGLIVADPGILKTARQTVPSLPIHLSTQANVTNGASAAFWADQGACRINLARELSIKEIGQIRGETTTEIEIFVHGALCISYSGRCLLSHYMTGRSANRGHCAHPCRYSYHLVEEKRPGEYFPVVEDDRGTYIFSAKDLCLINRLPELVTIGVNALKIEGRMKSTAYVGSVVRVYRAALDWLAAWQKEHGTLKECKIPDRYIEELAKVGTRGQTENFFDGPPGEEGMNYKDVHPTLQWIPGGVVQSVDPLTIETKTNLAVGDRLQYLGPQCRNIDVTIDRMCESNLQMKERVNPSSQVILVTDPPIPNPSPHGLLRKKMQSRED